MVRNPTEKETEEFHRKKHLIGKVILSKTGKHETIYGAQAINKQVPKHLRKGTTDYDIYSNTPKKDAVQTEKALDKRFGGNFFFVVPAKHGGTHKVKSYSGQEGYADYTKPENKIPRKKIGKHYYIRAGAIKTHINKTLKDKEAAYRHAKDRDALNRLNAAEAYKRKQQLMRRKKRTLLNPLMWR